MWDMTEIFVLVAEDVQEIALEKIGRKLTCIEMFEVNDMMNSHFGCWVDFIEDTIDEIAKKDYPSFVKKK